MAVHSNILAWEILWTEEPAGYRPWGCKELGMIEHHTQCREYMLEDEGPQLRLEARAGCSQVVKRKGLSRVEKKGNAHHQGAMPLP